MLQHETNNKCVKKRVFCEYSVSGQTALEEVKRVCNGLGWVGGHGWGTWGWGIQRQRVKRLGGDEGLGGWLVMPPIKGRGNHLPRGIIGGLGNLNISSLSHLSSLPVLKKWIERERYWKGRRIYFCPSAKVSPITHSIVNRESAVSIKTHFKKNCIWSYYSSNTFPTYFNTFWYNSKLRKTALWWYYFSDAIRIETWVYLIAVDFGWFRWSIASNTCKFCQRLIMDEFSTDWQQGLEKEVTVNTSPLPFKIRPTPVHAIVELNGWCNGFSK